jgi:hypothetical protein
MRSIILLILVILSLGFLQFYLLDGLDGWFFGLSGKEVTYYSNGYSDSGFRRIRLGMSEGDVLRYLGEPLSRYSIGEGTKAGWRYSGRRVDTDYRVRVIIFENGRVEKKVSEYYVD